MKFAIKTNNGHYFTAEAGGGREIVANRTDARGWELFELEEFPDANVALKACNGQYVCAENGGGAGLVANRDKVAGWELFKLVKVGVGQIGLRACNGQFVCAEQGGGQEVVVNRSTMSGWETFKLVLQIDTDLGLLPIDLSNDSALASLGPFWQKIKDAINAKMPKSKWDVIPFMLTMQDNDPEQFKQHERERELDLDRKFGRDWGGGRSETGTREAGVDDTAAGREEAGRTA